jgi:hypothetical protein
MGGLEKIAAAFNADALHAVGINLRDVDFFRLLRKVDRRARQQGKYAKEQEEGSGWAGEHG